MKLWVVATGEPWPTDAGKPRLQRGGIFARHCAAAGDEVTWWSGVFDHHAKANRAEMDVIVDVEPGLTLRGLHASTIYRRNVSVARLVNHAQLGSAFARAIAKAPRPDAILVCMPLVEFAAEAVAYGRARGIPVVVDIRDMWPDVWVEAMPGALRSLAAVATSPYAARLRGALRGSAGVVAITDPILEWGLKLAGMPRRADDGVAPLAFALPTITPAERAAAEAYWDAQGVSPHGFTACYFGGLTQRTDPMVMLDAARAIPEADRNRIKLVICGDGDQLPALRAAAADLPHVLLPGWVDAPKILALQTRSKVGLIAYPNHMDFVLSVPNKVHEYWSAGLPVLSTLQGELARVLQAEAAGVAVARDPHAMASALLDLAGDRARLASLADGAREAGRRRSPELVYGDLRARMQRLVHRQAAA